MFAHLSMQRSLRLMSGPAASLALAVLALVIGACSDSTVTRIGNPGPDSLPDLFVDSAALDSSLLVDVETFPPGDCSAVEGNFPPGTYRVLRFTAVMANMGTVPAYMGDPLAHMDPNGDGDTTDTDHLYEWAPCHQHWHLRRFATYELLPVMGPDSFGPPIRGRKAGFCLADDRPLLGTDPATRKYRNCGGLREHGNQGISPGWSDVYSRSIDGQFFLLGDSASPVLPGQYLIRIVVNAPYIRLGATDPCPVIDDAGNCRLFKESDYANDTVAVPVTITATSVRVARRWR